MNKTIVLKTPAGVTHISYAGNHYTASKGQIEVPAEAYDSLRQAGFTPVSPSKSRSKTAAPTAEAAEPTCASAPQD